MDFLMKGGNSTYYNDVSTSTVVRTIGTDGNKVVIIVLSYQMITVTTLTNLKNLT